MSSTLPLKIIFFGTSDRSFPILESLKSHFHLILCVTKTDTKVGRKQTSKESGVKTWAKQNQINFLEIDSLKGDDLQKTIKEIEKLKPDYGVVSDFSIIIPSEVIKLFDIRLINIHFSLLPKYRGACPVQFAILNGDETTGVTFHIVNEKLDNGAIISQIGYKMNNKETAGELYKTLFKIAADKLPEVLEKYSQGQITPLPQDANLATFTLSKTRPKSTFIYKEDVLINWGEKPKKIERAVRSFNPWPISWSYLKDLEKAKCLAAGKIKLKKSVDKELKIKIFKAGIQDGKLDIQELQVEGKNKTAWKDFANGYLDSAN